MDEARQGSSYKTLLEGIDLVTEGLPGQLKPDGKFTSTDFRLLAGSDNKITQDELLNGVKRKILGQKEALANEVQDLRDQRALIEESRPNMSQKRFDAQMERITAAEGELEKKKEAISGFMGRFKKITEEEIFEGKPNDYRMSKDEFIKRLADLNETTEQRKGTIMVDRFDPNNLSEADRKYIRSGLDMNGDGKITDSDIKDIAAKSGDSGVIDNNDIANSIKDKEIIGGDGKTKIGKADEFRARMGKILTGNPAARYSASVEEFTAALEKAGIYDGVGAATPPAPETPPRGGFGAPAPATGADPVQNAPKVPLEVLKKMAGALDVIGETPGTKPDGKVSSAAFDKVAGADGKVTAQELVDALEAAAPPNKKPTPQAKAAALDGFKKALFFDGKTELTREELAGRMEAIGMPTAVEGVARETGPKLTPDQAKKLGMIMDVIGETPGTKPDGKFADKAFDAVAGEGGKITAQEIVTAMEAAAPPNKKPTAQAKAGMLDALEKTFFYDGKKELSKEEFSTRMKEAGMPNGVGSSGPPALPPEILQGMKLAFDVIGETPGTRPDGKFSEQAYKNVAGADGKVTAAEIVTAMEAAAPPNRKPTAEGKAAMKDGLEKTFFYDGKTELTQQELSERMKAVGLTGGVEGAPGGSQPLPGAGGTRQR